ncbi:hypothetical protein [Actinoplanes sp. TFC3]|uniref:hypothetical protein n=1 Tax=Actinoplanes sp. TFC3 TaxID=1710355 RepID=UPI0008345F0A|nr:hypothetical protein [Actinoplanes sp. TFC3]
MKPTIALLPSALLGPAVWQPVHAALTRRGWDVITADGRGSSTAEVQSRYLDGLPDDRPYFVVPHSNAGLYVPGIVAVRSVAACVFVDAVLPGRAGDVPVAPEPLLVLLRDLADPDGMLPPWTEWWAQEDVAALFPDAEVRAQVAAEQQRLPLSYFEETVAVSADWSRVPAAYVAFGETYADECREAESRGWPTTELTGNHLHMLHDPEGTAEAIHRSLP